MTKFTRLPFAALATAATILSATMAAPARADIAIAQLDGVSGPFANVGEQQRITLQTVIDDINGRGGVNGETFKLVTIDGKGNPQETLNAFRQAVDQGIRIVTQGNSSSVAAALSNAVAKHNDRNPDDPVLYLNHSAIDNDLTDSKCNFWHFRFDASVAMRTKAVMKKLGSDNFVRKLFMINQNYALGQQASANMKQWISKVRDDLQVVGDELHPLGQVKDFSPYVAKIAQSGADTVFTANWGNDLALLVKAIRDAGLKVRIYTFYGAGYGAPAAMGDAAIGRIYVVSEWHENVSPNPLAAFAADFEKRTGNDWLFHHIRSMLLLLEKAVAQAGPKNIAAIAGALENASADAGTGQVSMRAKDHQMLQRLYISHAVKALGAGGSDPRAKYDAEKSGVAFVTDEVIEPAETVVETACQMKRP